MPGLNLLGGLPDRWRAEARCVTVDGGADLVMNPDDLEDDAVTWVTVPDLEEILAAVADRSSAAGRRQQLQDLPGEIAALAEELPRLGVGYPAAEFEQRFGLLLRSITLLGQIQRFDEADDLADTAARFVLTEATDTDPFLTDLAGRLLWTVAEVFAAEEYFFDALRHRLLAGRLLRESGVPPETVAGYAVTTAGKCLTLIESATPPRARLLDLAREALDQVGAAQRELPFVQAARFQVARLSGDQEELTSLAGQDGAGALELGELRVATLLSRFPHDDDWRVEFGPFAPAIVACCRDLGQADGFRRLDQDDSLPVPGTGPGHRAALIGQVTFAEPKCDEVSSGITQWLDGAVRRGEQYVVDGATRRVRRSVPTSALHTLVPFASRDPDDLPDAVRFLFERGSAAARAEPGRIHDWIEHTLAFLDGDDAHEAAFTCAGILVGAARELVPPGRLRHYVTALEVVPHHRAALQAARGDFPHAATAGAS